MYNVSSEYLKAVTKPDREFKILVHFDYKDGSQADFSDSTILGEVEIASQAIAGSANSDTIDIGGALAAKAILTVIDDNISLHRYTGASFSIQVFLKLESGEFEKVPMGHFFVDASKLSRIGNQISIVGYDSMLSLMYMLSDEHRQQLKNQTAEQAVQFLAAYSNCGFEQDLSELPNSNVPLDFDSPQIETARDGVMWISQLMGCFARVNRQGYLEFVPIKSKWVYYNDEHTVGTIIAVRNIQGSERYYTKFADDRIHIVGVSMPDRDNKLVTRSSSGLKGDANITIALDKNPLVINSSLSLWDILGAILTQVRTTYFYAFKTEIINDPALDAGDTIRLQSGIIQGTNKNNDLIGFITHNVWRYRGHHEITNAGQVPIIYAEDETTVALASDTAKSADPSSDLYYLPPKSQMEKAFSAGNALPDRLIINNAVAQLSGGNGYNVGMDFRDNSAASANRKYIGQIEFYDGGNDEIALRIQLGSRGYTGSSEIILSNPGRTICQEGSIQYGGGSDYTYGFGRICFNAKEGNNNKPVELRFNSDEGYSYAMQFTPSGVTFSNGKGGSFTIPFTTTAKEEE